MAVVPPKINLAHLPTPIRLLRQAPNGCQIFVKQDELTGFGLTGNKFCLAEAQSKGAKAVMTCGAVQSHHARATCIAARQLGLEVYLLLRGSPESPVDGELLLDVIMGATIRWCTPQQYSAERNQIMAGWAASIPDCHVIPEGASNALGCWGYATAVKEIVEQTGLSFPYTHICVAVGSGGTVAGLLLGRKMAGVQTQLIGFPVCDDNAYFQQEVERLLREFAEQFQYDPAGCLDNFRLDDKYKGPAYGVVYEAQLQSMKSFARSDGLLLDPTYTGKAFHGMLAEIESGAIPPNSRVLFIHTGGAFTLFEQKAVFSK